MVIEWRRCARFRENPLTVFPFLHDLVSEQLDGDRALQARVKGAVDHSHAAAAEFRLDSVLPEGLPDEARGLPQDSTSGIHRILELRLDGLTKRLVVTAVLIEERRSRFRIERGCPEGQLCCSILILICHDLAFSSLNCASGG